MSKISTIISREYTTRVRKKSFLIMSIIGPILFAAMMIVPAMMVQMDDTEEKIIAVSDSSQLFYNVFPETEYIKFVYLPNANINEHKENFYNSPYYAILHISHIIVNTPSAVQLFSDKSPGLGVRMHISNAIEKTLEREKLKTYEIEESVLNAIKTNVTIRSVKMDKDGGESEVNFTLRSIVGYIAGFLIYFTIFFSGAQVMRGVIEEKTSRIVEIVISSVKPYQLMLGKVVGVGLVSLTQFAIWGGLTMALYSVAAPLVMPDVTELTNNVEVQSFMDTGSSLQAQQPTTEIANSELTKLFTSLGDVNFVVIILSFLFYFFGGYFLYGAIFAAIGSAVDADTDMQQFMLPVTIPLVLAMFVMIHAVQNPESQLAVWFSIIPFTSPIVMMARIPFGVPWEQVILSILLLIITFAFITWMAAKIYRTGILMYGKKTSWKEMWKWLRYKN